MEEKNNVSKNRWKRLIKKKWFFPAVYLGVAALLLTGVLWYQNIVNQTNDFAEDMQEQFTEHNKTAPDDEEATPVMQQQEVLKMPVAEDLQVEVVTKFYDYNASEEEQEQGLIFYQNKFSQSKGIDIVSTSNETFEVKAALSGKVVEIDQDPLLGNIVKLEHEEGISTYYASLDDIMIEEGSNIAQGQTIGTAGVNALGEDNGIHVHFQVRKDGTPVNPENFINQPINKIVNPQTGEEDDSEQVDEAEEENTDLDQDEDSDENTSEQEDQQHEEADETEEQEEENA
ncbi:stage II sporulation protein Q [Gracilibacillus halotolerans]|uniref:Stage II sporulation protein Q n=1 Tax=Gracilibacillus halotolerans TaxID=74386 RepID=A0A841RP21_9BACI|nr:M23 family metallopeptidase [Gracilibacillus halotolerans]MBB6513627.1 stage II sporulation protein Q [Gracilibacillus halotolerans]